MQPLRLVGTITVALPPSRSRLPGLSKSARSVTAPVPAVTIPLTAAMRPLTGYFFPPAMRSSTSGIRLINPSGEPYCSMSPVT